MNEGLTTLAEVETALAERGFALRGAFHPTAADDAPLLPDDRLAATLALAGNVGPAMWRAFAPHRGSTSLDDWCRREIGRVADRFGAAAIFPQDGPPYPPFQRWAKRAEPVAESPIGILIHPDYGLWHGYRGALLFAARLALPAPDRRAIPCATCAEKPCLTSCPVGAFTGARYDLAACVGHLARAEGADCMGEGCRARRACPVGRAYAYGPAQAAFHMTAFLRAQRG